MDDLIMAPHDAVERQLAAMTEPMGMHEVVRLYNEGGEGGLLGLSLESVRGYELSSNELHMYARALEWGMVGCKHVRSLA